MVFAGRGFSYETWHQAVRRCWRYGQKRQVNVHLVIADGENAIARVIDRKSGDAVKMQAQMVLAMKRAMGQSANRRVAYHPTFQARTPEWLA
jgi:hypothetical protein